MLKCPLDPLYVEWCFANVDSVILGIFNTESKSRSFVPAFPTATIFRKITFSYADANVFIVEKSTVKLEKIYQMFA